MFKNAHDGIINILGINHLPVQERIEIIDRTTSIVQSRMFLRIMQVLPEAAYEQFAFALEQLDERALHELFKTHKIDTDTIMLEEIHRAKKELVELARV